MNHVLEKLHQLPSIPAVVQELIASFDNPELDTQKLALKIGQDQALSAKVLRVANSAFYGLPRQIGSIQEAVTVLGFSTIRSLVLSAGFIDTFLSDDVATVDRKLYWQRSLAIATYAKSVARCLRQDGEMAFSAGLLCDIGILVLDVCDQARFAAVWQSVQGEGSALIEAERAALGFDHAELGAEVARRWKFPDAIEEAIRYHYQPGHQPLKMLTGIVQLAAFLVRFNEEKLPESEWFGHIPQTLLEALRVDWESLHKCLPLPEQIEAAKNLIIT